MDATLHGQQLVSLQDVPRANIVDAIYKKYCMNEATLSITLLFFFKHTSRDSCSWSTVYVHLYSSSCCHVSFLIFPCSPLHPRQQDQCVCMFPLAPRPARPVCVYVPPCTPASKASVCVYACALCMHVYMYCTHSKLRPPFLLVSLATSMGGGL